MRLQKFLSSKGFGSRRKVEILIQEKRIKVNGKIAEIGDLVSGEEVFLIDGDELELNQEETKHQHLIYNKDNDEICSRFDPEGRKSVFDSLPIIKFKRWVAVGRLDMTTTGLIIFTTDGELANNLMHPSKQIIRTYLVRIFGKPTTNTIKRLKQGIRLEDGLASFQNIQVTSQTKSNTWCKVSLAEGRKHEVKRLWKAVGHKVNKLIRIEYGPVKLPKSLKRGNYESLNDKEIKILYDAV
ncbi:MAG TPA: pseudouridine synthase [Woeseiaceae bacterium]|nr:pseudouridine synthase [Woeseiaceae bacterium]